MKTLGWREWVRLPDLGASWIKAKVDTGARSSSLHAFGLETFERDGREWVRFSPHGDGHDPIEVPLLDSRAVKSSSGTSELRPVIRTRMLLGGVDRDIDLTLTRRDEMGFPMLVGREALRGEFTVDPGRSFLTGRPAREGEREPVDMGGTRIPPGTQKRVELPIAMLASGTQVSLPVSVVHGKQPGPTVWLSAAIHGDEVGGVEIIRRVSQHLSPKTLRGTVLSVPVVNVHGFVTGDRYLPDRRDLNRSFPGGSRGSLARRIAHLLLTEVVAKCSVGIDLHTGSDGRTNLPQLRADLTDPETLRLAAAFGARIMMSSAPREGSLRRSATKAGATVLLYEGGESSRFDIRAIEGGTAGVLRVLAELDMIDPVVEPLVTPLRSEGGRWVRATRSGILLLDCALGDYVEKGQVVGRIHDSFGEQLSRCKSPVAGTVVGLKLEPMVNRGDALAHIAPAAAYPPETP